MSGGRMLDGRVPIWVEEHGGSGDRRHQPVVVVHDHGTSPADAWPLVKALAPHQCLVPHLRGHGRSGWVRGGVYTPADHAADLVRVLRLPDGPAVVVALGRSVLTAAIGATVEPARVVGLVLAPGEQAIECGDDPRPARTRWIRVAGAMTADGGAALDADESRQDVGGEVDERVDPMASVPWSEPLYPADRDELWSTLVVPVVWLGDPQGEWARHAPGERAGRRAGDLSDDVASAVARWR